VDVNKQTYEVQIAGLALKLRSSHDAQTVNELIELVNERVQKVLSTNPNISFQKALILASLHIAEDLVLLKRTTHTELDDLEIKAKRILTELESSPIARIRLDN
jgi:cell division protein ZapA (FtsZ GTPase activity inhibitor)